MPIDSADVPQVAPDQGGAFRGMLVDVSVAARAALVRHVEALVSRPRNVLLADVLSAWRDVVKPGADPDAQLREEVARARLVRPRERLPAAAVVEAVRTCLEFPRRCALWSDLLVCAEGLSYARDEAAIGLGQRLGEACSSGTATLADAHSLTEELRRSTEAVPQDELEGLREELKVLATPEGRRLIDFVKRYRQENFRLLELPEQLRSDTYRDLDITRRRVLPLVAPDPAATLDTFVQRLREWPAELQEVQRIPGAVARKLRNCCEQLHILEPHFATRSEATRNSVADACRTGVYRFSAGDGRASLVLQTARPDGDQRTSDVEEVRGLRARAALLLSAGGSESVAEHRALLLAFIDDSSKAEEILRLLQDLQSASGAYRRWERSVSGREAVKALKAELQEHLELCRQAADEARGAQEPLASFLTQELWRLFDFLRSEDPAAAAPLVSGLVRCFVPAAGVEQVLAARAACVGGAPLPEATDPRACLLRVADFLVACEARGGGRAQPTPLPKSVRQIVARASPAVRQTSAPLQMVEVEIPRLVSHVLLELFAADGAIPAGSACLFCAAETGREELRLLFERARHAAARGGRERFYVVHAEALPHPLQLELAEALRRLQQEGARARVAVVCCGRREQLKHVRALAELKPATRAGLSEADAAAVVRGLLPDARLVTSDGAGLGKSDRVRQLAAEAGRSLAYLPLYDAARAPEVLERLRGLGLESPGRALHVDVGPLASPEAANLLLFRLLVLRSASAGGAVFHTPALLPTYVELANMPGGRLRRALSFCGLLRAEHLAWSMERLRISEEPDADVQVVCRYLKALDEERLPREDVPADSGAPVPRGECAALLQRHFFDAKPHASFTALRSFVAALSHELRRLSGAGRNCLSAAVIEEALRPARAELVQKLVESAALLASAYDRAEHARRQAADGDEVAESVLRFSGMVRWAERTDVLVTFQESGSITALYREARDVPDHLRAYLDSQSTRSERGLRQYGAEDSEKLLEMLQRFLPVTRALKPVPANYVLTPDNLLKLVQIWKRIEANIPVIIRGSTGCGKTCLVEVLCEQMGYVLVKLACHAGTTEADIVAAVRAAEAAARGGRGVVLFLDEINTCEHLGLLSEALCQRTRGGAAIDPGVRFVAACNPYERLPEPRGDREVVEAGLGRPAAAASDRDPRSGLLYRVNPLPDRVADFCWDFGALHAADERRYIIAMFRRSAFARGLPPGSPLTEALVVDLLADSQRFAKERLEYGEASVSLRDVARCVYLADKLRALLEARRELEGACGGPRMPLEVRALLLALGHCYHSRLAGRGARWDYRRKLASRLDPEVADEAAETIRRVIEHEQGDVVRRMRLPPGTACNEALRENVYSLLVSVLFRIPIMLVGKPGCSKTLALRLLFDGLRGRFSEDAFFRRLPDLLAVSYQGSQQSTSEGIQRVFQRARRLAADMAGGGGDAGDRVAGLPATCVVVLMDEIGLADLSPFNPNKVLHAELDPVYRPFQGGDANGLDEAHGRVPDVSFVGISNFRLDASKMNRVVLLSRPDPTLTDLELTIEAVARACTDGGRHRTLLDPARQRGLAKAYDRLQKDMARTSLPNYFGLRDVYNLVKMLAARGACSREDAAGHVAYAVRRNMGGLEGGPGRAEAVVRDFLDAMGLRDVQAPPPPPFERMLVDNVRDESARHLLVVASCPQAPEALQRLLARALPDGARRTRLFRGSSFAGDIGSEEFLCRQLSDIIVACEGDRISILQNLPLYTNLYDLFNRSRGASQGGERPTCRVASGQHSVNCYVSDEARIVVVVDPAEIEHLDPPMLNRFEKQVFHLRDQLTAEHQAALAELRKWAILASSVDEATFTPLHVWRTACGLAGGGDGGDVEGALVSLVARYASLPAPEALARAKEDVVRVMPEDAAVRLRLSRLDRDEAGRCLELHRSRQEHRSLDRLVLGAVARWRDGGAPGAGVSLVAQTFSSPRVALRVAGLETACLHLAEVDCAAELRLRLGDFFSADSPAALLAVVCRAPEDEALMRDAREAVERQQHEWRTPPAKHVLFLVHVDRAARHASPFLPCEPWVVSTVDLLEPVALAGVPVEAAALLDQPPGRFLAGGGAPLFDALVASLRERTLATIRYGRPRAAEGAALDGLWESPGAVRFLKEQALRCLRRADERPGGGAWGLSVAADFEALVLSSSLAGALLDKLQDRVWGALAKLVYFLEREELVGPLLEDAAALQARLAEAGEEVGVRLEAFEEGVRDPQPGGYPVDGPRPPRRVALSAAFFRLVEQHRGAVLLELAAAREAAERLYGVAEEEKVQQAEEAAARRAADGLRATLRREARAAWDAVGRASDYAQDFCIDVAAGLELAGWPSLELAWRAVLRVLGTVQPQFEDAAELHVAWWRRTPEAGACLDLLRELASFDPAAVAGEAANGDLRVSVADALSLVVLGRFNAADSPAAAAAALQDAHRAAAAIRRGGDFGGRPTRAVQVLRVVADVAACLPDDEAGVAAVRRVLAAVDGCGGLAAAAGEILHAPAFLSALSTILDGLPATAGAAAARLESDLLVRACSALDLSDPSARAVAQHAVERALWPAPRLAFGPGARLVLQELIGAEDGRQPVADVLTDPGRIERSPALAAVNGALRQRPVGGEHWAFVGDALAHGGFADVAAEQVAHESLEAPDTAQLLLRAVETLQAEGAEPLSVVLAATFARSCLGAAAEHLVPGAHRAGLSADVVAALGEIGAARGDRPEALRVALAQQMLRKMAPAGRSLARLRSWCRDELELPEGLRWLAELPWSAAAGSALDYAPFLSDEGFAEADAAFERLRMGDRGGLQRLGLGGPPRDAQAALQAAASRLYLARAAGPLSDRDRRAAAALAEGAPPAAGALLRFFAGPAAAGLPSPCFLELLPGGDAQGVHLAALAARFGALLAALPPTASPFHQLFAGGPAAAAGFLPGIMSCPRRIGFFEDWLRSGRVSGFSPHRYTVWRHECGEEYDIEDCGAPNQSWPCPNDACRARGGRLGGSALHVPEAGNVDVSAEALAPLPGVHALPARTLAYDQLNDRELTPPIFRLLHLLTNLALAASAAAGRAGDAAAVEDCLAAVRADVGVLERMLDLDAERACLAVHGALREFGADLLAGRAAFAAAPESTADDAARARFEREFARRYLGPLAERGGAGAAAAAVRASCLPPARDRSARFEAAVELRHEVALAAAPPERYDAGALPRLLGPAALASGDSFAHFALDPADAARFPALEAILRSADALRGVGSLAPALDFLRLVRRLAEGRLGRDEAAETTVGELLRASGGEREAGRAFGRCRGSLLALRDLWRAGALPAQHECRAIDYEALDRLLDRGDDAWLGFPVSFFIVGEARATDGLVMCALLDHIVTTHNDVLWRLRELAAPPRGCRAVAFLAGEPPEPLGILDAREDDLCGLPAGGALQRLLQAHATPALGLAGAGRTALAYDFGRLEAELLGAGFAGRRPLAVGGWDEAGRAWAELVPFPYHLDLSSSRYSLMHEVAKRVPQRRVPAAAAGAIRRSAEVRAALHQLLGCLGTVLATVCQAPRWPRDFALRDFADRFDPASPERALLGADAFRGLTLEHACDLYDLLELARTEVVVRAFPDALSAKLPDAADAQLRAKLGPGAAEPASPPLPRLALATARLVSRRVASGAVKPQRATMCTLAAELALPELWASAEHGDGEAPAEEELRALVPQSLTLAHARAFHALLQGLLQSTSGAPAGAAPPAAGPSGQAAPAAPPRSRGPARGGRRTYK